MPEGATKENALAAKESEYCSRLFEIEQKLEGLSDDERYRQRQPLSKPIVEEYYAWQQTRFKPSGKLKKAITYSLNQREYYCAFLDHGEIEISNSQVENAIRPIVVGRKNWLFCDTQAGANASVVVFTMLETAKADGLRQYRAKEVGGWKPKGFSSRPLGRPSLSIWKIESDASADK